MPIIAELHGSSSATSFGTATVAIHLSTDSYALDQTMYLAITNKTTGVPAAPIEISAYGLLLSTGGWVLVEGNDFPTALQYLSVYRAVGTPTFGGVGVATWAAADQTQIAVVLIKVRNRISGNAANATAVAASTTLTVPLTVGAGSGVLGFWATDVAAAIAPASDMTELVEDGPGIRMSASWANSAPAAMVSTFDASEAVAVAIAIDLDLYPDSTILGSAGGAKYTEIGPGEFFKGHRWSLQMTVNDGATPASDIDISGHEYQLRMSTDAEGDKLLVTKTLGSGVTLRTPGSGVVWMVLDASDSSAATVQEGQWYYFWVDRTDTPADMAAYGRVWMTRAP